MLVSPGRLWDLGKGHLGKERNVTLYYAMVRSRGRVVIAEGTAIWFWTSVGDSEDAVMFLMEQALMSESRRHGQVGVNRDG